MTQTKTISTELLQEIIDGCEGVTPGPWRDGSGVPPTVTTAWNDADGDRLVVCTLPQGAGYVSPETRDTAAHISRLDPATVKAMAELALSALASRHQEPVNEPVPDIETKLAQLDEIADGAWGDNPMVRGKARDEAERLRAASIPKPGVTGLPVTLAECPIGLFYAGGELCLKTEYGDNNGRIDAYIVSSGEFFWGGTSAPQEQRKVLVQPFEFPPSTSEGEADRCFICGQPIKPGDMVLQDVTEGLGHRVCFGGDRDAFVKDVDTGEPLGPDDPLPTGWPYEPEEPQPAPVVTDEMVERFSDEFAKGRGLMQPSKSFIHRCLTAALQTEQESGE